MTECPSFVLGSNTSWSPLGFPLAVQACKSPDDNKHKGNKCRTICPGTSLSYSIFRKITSIKKIQHCSLTIYVYNLVLYSLSRLDAKLVNDIKIITLRT